MSLLSAAPNDEEMEETVEEGEEAQSEDKASSEGQKAESNAAEEVQSKSVEGQQPAGEVSLYCTNVLHSSIVIRPEEIYHTAFS